MLTVSSYVIFLPIHGQTHCHSPLDGQTVCSFGVKRISKMQDGILHRVESEFCICWRTPQNIFKCRQRQCGQAVLQSILMGAAKQSRANTLPLPIAMNGKLPKVKLMVKNFGTQKPGQAAL